MCVAYCINSLYSYFWWIDKDLHPVRFAFLQASSAIFRKPDHYQTLWYKRLPFPPLSILSHRASLSFTLHGTSRLSEPSSVRPLCQRVCILSTRSRVFPRRQKGKWKWTPRRTGSTTNPIRGKRVFSKQTLREGPVGKETTGERIQTLSGSLSGKRSGPSPVYAYIITHLSAIVKRFLEKSLRFFESFFEEVFEWALQWVNSSYLPAT